MIEVRVTHIGGPTALIEVDGWRILQDAVELCGLIRPRTAIPVHYEGWKHFRQGRVVMEREFARAPEDVRARIRWLPIGAPVELPA